MVLRDRVRQGDPIASNISARKQNRACEAADIVLNQQGDTRVSRGGVRVGPNQIKMVGHVTGSGGPANVPPCSIVSIGQPEIIPTKGNSAEEREFKNDPCWRAEPVTQRNIDRNNWAVVGDEYADDGCTFAATICGPAIVNVVIRDLDHQFACPVAGELFMDCLLYTSPSPRDLSTSRMPSSA